MSYLGTIASRAVGALATTPLVPVSRSRSPVSEFDQRLSSLELAADAGQLPAPLTSDLVPSQFAEPELQVTQIAPAAFAAAPLEPAPRRGHDALTNQNGFDAPGSFEGTPSRVANDKSSFDSGTERGLEPAAHVAPVRFNATPDGFGAAPDRFNAIPDRFSAIPDSFSAIPDSFSAARGGLNATSREVSISELVQESHAEPRSSSQREGSVPSVVSSNREFERLHPTSREPSPTPSATAALSQALSTIDAWLREPARPRDIERTNASGSAHAEAVPRALAHVVAEPKQARVDAQLLAMQTQRPHSPAMQAAPRLTIGQIEIEVVQQSNHQALQRAEAISRRVARTPAAAAGSVPTRSSALDAKLGFGMRQR